MASTSMIQFKNQYEDETTSNLSVGPIDSTALNIEQLRTKVKAFNAEIGTNGFATKLVSKGGAPWRGISAVTITTTEREYIF